MDAASVVVASLTRTLTAAGFEIASGRRLPSHLEILAERADEFGGRPRYLFALTELEALPAEQIPSITETARLEQAFPVLVSVIPADGYVLLDALLDLLGGPVPSWRAIGDTFRDALLVASQNSVPAGMHGEAWLIFEDLVADGLTFALGRRVNRLGGRTRGRPVSDMLAILPDRSLLVVDAKATASQFDATLASLRPLGEYVKRQVLRQTGSNEVVAALVVSAGFRQDEARLIEVASEFLTAYGRTVCFIEAMQLASVVETMKANVDLRLALQWRRLFRPGAFRVPTFQEEVAHARQERVAR